MDTRFSLISLLAALATLTVGVSGSFVEQSHGLTTLTGERRLLQEDLLNLYRSAYKDVPTQLRTAILGGDLNMAIALLTSIKDADELGEGLRFPEGPASQYDIYTPERNTDPDVITIKAMAGASLRLAECGWAGSASDDPSTSNPQVLGILKLAKAFIVAITPASGVFPKGVNQFQLHVEVMTMLADREFMQQIRDDDVLASQLNRKLLIESGSPVRTWLCSRCYPRKFCRNSCWWCAK